jgi:hypothetical protein
MRWWTSQALRRATPPSLWLPSSCSSTAHSCTSCCRSSSSFLSSSWSCSS